MSRLMIAIIAVIMIVSSLLSAAAVDSVEVRSPAVNPYNGTSVTWGSQQLWGTEEPQSKFTGFYYDIDDDLGTESITLNINEAGVLDGSSEPKGIIYKTGAQDKAFKFHRWGNYLSIGFLGENYLAGYSSAEIGDAHPYLYEKSTDSNVLDKELLLKVLIDDDDQTIAFSGSKFPLKEGYEIEIKGVDINGNTVYLQLLKNGQVVGESTITPSDDSDNIKDSTYCYTNDIANLKGIALIAIHFKNSFRSSDREAATIDGIFQVSDVPVGVASNTEYGKMTVTSVGSDAVTLENEDRSVNLVSDMDKEIMNGLFIRTADQMATPEDPLRFYLYRKITEPGTYEVRGVARDAVGGADISWDATDFPGFYYDLDNNLGGESLQLSLSASPTKDSSEPAEAIYRTVAEECEFDFKNWQKYYAIGFLGEKCFAGYVSNDSDPQSNSRLYSESTDTNIMDDEILSSVLIDDDDEREPMGVGSSIELKEGYELKITSIDTKGDKIVVKLSKDGKDVEPERVLDLDEESDYCYKRNLGSSGEIVTIAVHFNNAFSGSEANMATVQGIWQISDTPIDISENRKIGKMTIQSVSSKKGDMSVEMNNEDDTVKLGSDKDISLMGDICIKTSDLSDKPSDTTLKLYVYKKVTVGTGETETERIDSDLANADGSRPDTEKVTTSVNETNVSEKPDGARETPGFTSIMAFIGLLAMLFARRSGQ